jgi:hypothetical protein
MCSISFPSYPFESFHNPFSDDDDDNDAASIVHPSSFFFLLLWHFPFRGLLGVPETVSKKEQEKILRGS